MSDKREDILKKLRSAKKELQTSLEEEELQEDQKIELVEGQKDLELKEKKREILDEDRDAPSTKKSRFYRSTDGKGVRDVPRELKSHDGLSRKKLAKVQRRIKDTAMARKTLTTKQRALLVIGIILASMPLVMINSLSLVSCRFYFDDVGVTYRDRPGAITVTVPVYNPSFIPAHLGELSLRLYDRETNRYVADFYSNELKTVDPYETTTLELNVNLDPDAAGIWLSNIINTFTLDLYIRDFYYNGILAAAEVPLPVIDLSGMVASLMSGLDMGSLMSSSPSDASNSLRAASSNSGREVIDPLVELREQDASGPLSASDTPSFELFNLFIEEDENQMDLILDVGFGLSAIRNFYFGPIKLSSFNISLYGPSQNLGSGNREDYTAPIAQLTSLDPEKYNITSHNYQGDLRDTEVGVEINFGAMSYAAIKLTLFKDNIEGPTHPSAFIDFNDPNAVDEFVAENATSYPTWNFFNNLLAYQKIDALIGINHLDVELFGIQIPDLSIDEDFLPVIQMEDIFDIDDLTSGLIGAPIGMFGAIGMVREVATSSMLGLHALPWAAGCGPYDPRIAQGFDLDELGDMISIGDFDMDMIQESLGPDANLSVGLSIDIFNTMIDLHIGLAGVNLSIVNTIDDHGYEETRAFAYAELLNNFDMSDEIYIPGTGIDGEGSHTSILIKAYLLTSPDYAPHVAAFIREILENWNLDATAILNIRSLQLFQENYTFAGIEIGLGLDGLIDLESEIEGLVRDALDGLLAPDEENNNSDTTSADQYVHPLFYPIQLISQIVLTNPLTQTLTGLNPPGQMSLTAQDGAPVEGPKTAQSIDRIEVINIPMGVDIELAVSDIDIGDTLPITLALGYTNLRIQTRNQYDAWEDIIRFRQEGYVELSEGPFDIYAALRIYYGEALCSFLHNLLHAQNFDLGLAGAITLNISGVYIPEIQLNLRIEELNLGFNSSTMLTPLIDDLISGMLDKQPHAQVLSRSTSEEIKMWDGNYEKLPFVSQSIDDFIDIGDVTLLGLEETEWPYKDRGEVTVDLAIVLTNRLMEFSLRDVSGAIYDSDGNRLITVNFGDGGDVRLVPGVPAEIDIQLVMHKSQHLEDYINGLLATFELTGIAELNLSITIFGCNIDDIEAIIDLGALGLDVGSLLNVILPISPKNFRNGPHYAQDIVDILGDFGLCYLTTGGQINRVGPNNREESMFDVTVGLALQPNFNISILEADLMLLDGIIFDAILAGNEANREDAVEYSKIARVALDPAPIYANNTVAPTDYFVREGESNPHNYPVVPEGKEFHDVIDPNKPYYDLSKRGVEGLHFTQQYDIENNPIFKAYGLGTFAMTELKLSLYNQSHGSFATAYPRRHWRNLGGPYFPVQVYGREHGGYPDHRVVYHPHFSPLANLLTGAMDAIDGDIGELLSQVNIAGTLRLNIFSMDIEFDAGSPLVQELLSSLTLETMNYFRKGFQEAATPFVQHQDPTMRDLALRSYRIPKDGGPIPAALYTDLQLDLESIIEDIPLVGLEERTDHIFTPAISSELTGRDMGTNIYPYDYRGNLIDGYLPGLDSDTNEGGSNVENFVKDYHYEHYKLIMDNFRRSRNSEVNPFFEYRQRAVDDEGNPLAYYGDPMENHEDWALRWTGAGGRCRTWAGIWIQGIVPKIEFGILSAFVPLWFDDPATGCSLAPMGYAWLNASVFPRAPTEEMPHPEIDNVGMIDDNGDPGRDSNWIPLNIRLFDSPQTRQFFSELISADFNIRFVADITLNVSIFGYEIYNVGIDGLGLGDTSAFLERCKQDLQYTLDGNIWGFPDETGTITPIETTPDWPPPEFLPQYEGDLGFDIELDALMDDLDFSIGIGLDWPNIIINADITIDTPIPLPVWIRKITATVLVTQNPDQPIDNWDHFADVDTGFLWRELNNYGHGDPNRNPYDFTINKIESQWVRSPETIGDLSAEINIGDVWKILGHLGLLFGTVYVCVSDLKIELMIPSAFENVIILEIDEEDLIFDFSVF